MRSSLQATALVLATVASAGTAQSSATVNRVPIVITYDGPIAPKSVSFDTDREGERSFVPKPGSFEGVGQETGAWIEHKVSLTYPSFSIPLLLRTWSDRQRVQLHGALWDVGCTPRDIRRVSSVNKNSTQRQMVGAIIASRYLSNLPESSCPKQVTREMGQRYFNLSCNLAKKVDFFGLSQDARQAFQDFGVGEAAELSACVKQARGVIIRKIYDDQKLALASNDWKRVEELTFELETLFSKSEWTDAFAVQGITETMFVGNDVIGQYRLTLQASNSGDFGEALELNQVLQQRFEADNGRQIFGYARIDITTLQEDAAYFATRTASR